MSNNYDTWKAGGYETERDEKLYTEEQILLEQIEILETRYKEKIDQVLMLQRQLKILAKIERNLSTFGFLSYEEQKQKQIILSIYETI